MVSPSLRQSAESLADLPQFSGHGVISGSVTHFLCGAAGEITPAQRFDSLLQGAVQCGLSTGLCVQEQQPGDGLDEDHLPQADMSGQLGLHDACSRGETAKICMFKNNAKIYRKLQKTTSQFKQQLI